MKDQKAPMPSVLHKMNQDSGWNETGQSRPWAAKSKDKVKRQTAVLMSATIGSPEQMKNTFLWGARLELLVLSATFLI